MIRNRDSAFSRKFSKSLHVDTCLESARYLGRRREKRNDSRRTTGKQRISLLRLVHALARPSQGQGRGFGSCLLLTIAKTYLLSALLFLPLADMPLQCTSCYCRSMVPKTTLCGAASPTHTLTSTRVSGCERLDQLIGHVTHLNSIGLNQYWRV